MGQTRYRKGPLEGRPTRKATRMCLYDAITGRSSVKAANNAIDADTAESDGQLEPKRRHKGT